MLKLKVKTAVIILFAQILLITSFSAKSDTSTDKTSKVDEPMMQQAGYSNITNAKLQELLDDNVVVVDIRRKEEWEQTGVIKGGKTITFFNKNGHVDKDFLPQFTAIAKKDQPIILICRSGNRTMAASQALVQQLGYKNVMNVTTGIKGWIKENRPVIKYYK